MTWGERRLAANRRTATASRRSRRRRRRCRRTPFAGRRRARDFDRRDAADRVPVAAHRRWPEELFSLTARPGFLRLYGRETIGSLFRQALVARRQQAHCYTAVTASSSQPAHYQQTGRPRLLLQQRQVPLPLRLDRRRRREAPARDVVAARTGAAGCVHAADPDPGGVPFSCASEVDYERLRFAYRVGDGEWQWLPQQFDASMLSDEATLPGRRTSPAHSSVWRARTWPARHCPPTSTTSSIANASTLPTPTACRGAEAPRYDSGTSGGASARRALLAPLLPVVPEDGRASPGRGDDLERAVLVGIDERELQPTPERL